MNVPVEYYLILGAILFAIGAFGVLLRRNIIVILMSVEIMLNAVNLTFVALALQTASMHGQVIVFFVIAVAAAEVAVGLAIVLANFAQRRTVLADQIASLRG